jgi:hypothetical protein
LGLADLRFAVLVGRDTNSIPDQPFEVKVMSPHMPHWVREESVGVANMADLLFV